MNIEQILNLATALQPLVQGGIVGIEHIIATIRVVKPEAEIDADFRALIVEALAAKADADKAARGDDPQ